MDAKPRNLGGSLPVPNVQELAARPADELTPPVLHRYIRDDVDADANSEAAASVPVVDLARLLDPSHGDEEASKLKAACEDWGFFQVLNHGVPDAVIADVKADLQAFFRLPLAEKRAVAQEPGGIEGVRAGLRRLRRPEAGLGRHPLPLHAAARVPGPALLAGAPRHVRGLAGPLLRRGAARRHPPAGGHGGQPGRGGHRDGDEAR